MFVPSHQAEIVKMSHTWVAECTCGWLGADQGTEAVADREAAEHERSPVHPLPHEWTPDMHPVRPDDSKTDVR